MAAVAGAGMWKIPYLSRNFELDIATIGLIMGLGGGVFGLIGQVGAGVVYDWARRFGPRGPLLVVAIGSAVQVAAMLTFLLSGSLAVVIAMACLSGMMTSIQAGPTNAAISQIAPAAALGTAFALYAVISNVIGAGFGPLIVGAISDLLGGGTEALRSAMIAVVSIQLLAVAAYVRASRHFVTAPAKA